MKYCKYCGRPRRIVAEENRYNEETGELEKVVLTWSCYRHNSAMENTYEFVKSEDVLAVRLSSHEHDVPETLGDYIEEPSDEI